MSNKEQQQKVLGASLNYRNSTSIISPHLTSTSYVSTTGIHNNNSNSNSSSMSGTFVSDTSSESGVDKQQQSNDRPPIPTSQSLSQIESVSPSKKINHQHNNSSGIISSFFHKDKTELEKLKEQEKQRIKDEKKKQKEKEKEQERLKEEEKQKQKDKAKEEKLKNKQLEKEKEKESKERVKELERMLELEKQKQKELKKNRMSLEIENTNNNSNDTGSISKRSSLSIFGSSSNSDKSKLQHANSFEHFTISPPPSNNNNNSKNNKPSSTKSESSAPPKITTTTTTTTTYSLDIPNQHLFPLGQHRGQSKLNLHSRIPTGSFTDNDISDESDLSLSSNNHSMIEHPSLLSDNPATDFSSASSTARYLQQQQRLNSNNNHNSNNNNQQSKSPNLMPSSASSSSSPSLSGIDVESSPTLTCIHSTSPTISSTPPPNPHIFSSSPNLTSAPFISETTLRKSAIYKRKLEDFYSYIYECEKSNQRYNPLQDKRRIFQRKTTVQNLLENSFKTKLLNQNNNNSNIVVSNNININQQQQNNNNNNISGKRKYLKPETHRRSQSASPSTSPSDLEITENNSNITNSVSPPPGVVSHFHNLSMGNLESTLKYNSNIINNNNSSNNNNNNNNITSNNNNNAIADKAKRKGLLKRTFNPNRLSLTLHSSGSRKHDYLDYGNIDNNNSNNNNNNSKQPFNILPSFDGGRLKKIQTSVKGLFNDGIAMPTIPIPSLFDKRKKDTTNSNNSNNNSKKTKEWR